MNPRNAKRAADAAAPGQTFMVPDVLMDQLVRSANWYIKPLMAMWFLTDKTGTCRASEYLIAWKSGVTRPTVREAIETGLRNEIFTQVEGGYQFLFPNISDNVACCVYCGGPAETVDHVIPLSLGGPDTHENKTIACAQCNRRKRDRTPEQAGMTMRFPSGRKVVSV